MSDGRSSSELSLDHSRSNSSLQAGATAGGVPASQSLGRGVIGEALLGGRRAGRPRPIPPKLYRIGELVGYSGVSRQTIHNYTTMGLLQESCWTEGGHRLYDESAFDRLNMIAELKFQRRSLEYIREYFAAKGTEEPATHTVPTGR